MGHLIWHARPGPGVTGSSRTIMVAAFSGWNDAGEAASGAIDHLWTAWGAEHIASIDPEEFMDFTVNRPRITVEAGVVEDLTWPETEIGWCAPGGSTSVVLVRGPEPQLRWRTFCAEVLGVADELGCGSALTLGAMLSDVPHTRPTPVFTNAHDPDLVDALPLPASQYEGPTGLPGVLHGLAHAAGLDSVALWAAVPAYAAGVNSPKASLALVEEVADIIGAEVGTDDLVDAANAYGVELDELVGEDEETEEYVRHLEESYDADSVAFRSADELVDEVEKFLREQ